MMRAWLDNAWTLRSRRRTRTSGLADRCNAQADMIRRRLSGGAAGGSGRAKEDEAQAGEGSSGAHQEVLEDAKIQKARMEGKESGCCEGRHYHGSQDHSRGDDQDDDCDHDDDDEDDDDEQIMTRTTTGKMSGRATRMTGPMASMTTKAGTMLLSCW